MSTSNWASSIKLYNTAARNDFSFRNTEVNGSPLQTQRNAERSQFGLLATSDHRINDRQRVNVRFWYQNADRNLPGTMVQESSSAKQLDESYRMTAEWQRIGKQVRINARAAYFDEALDWYAFETGPAAYSHSRNLIGEVEMKLKLKPGQAVNAGINNTFAQAVSEGYPDRPRQDRAALFASYQYSTKNGRSRNTLAARQEFMDGRAVPFTFSGGSEFRCTPWLTAKANISKVYRVPSFNDLYWNPGGNPDLLPESGYSGDLGLAAKWAPAKSPFTLTGEVTAFDRQVKNWILWLPGPAYWRPENILDVRSRGMETRGEVGMRIREVTVKFGVMTSYVLSTNETAKVANDASVGKQLIYVPTYSGNAKLSMVWRSLSATWMMNYTGYRYTSTDNLEFLAPFTLANAAIAYEVKSGKRYTAQLMAQGFNLFDTQYQAVRNRAMPMRNHQFGVRFQFNRPNTRSQEGK